MQRSSKRSRQVQSSDIGSEEDSDMENKEFNVKDEDDEMEEEAGDDDEELEADYDDDEGVDDEEEDNDELNNARKDGEIEELEKEYMELRHNEQDLLKNLKGHKDEDLLKGQAVKNQKGLWDKALELRFLLQKSFSNSNRLPQEPVKASFCVDNGVLAAYSDLISSSEKTLDSLLELQEALVENNPSIIQALEANNGQPSKHSESKNLDVEGDEKWLRISQMHSRIAPFRNKSIDKWQRKTDVTTGAAVIRGKLQAFNQNISEQVAAYMRDPSRMVKQMQLRRSTVSVFGADPHPEAMGNTNEENAQADGDPELLDDSDFYQQLLKEFFETIDPTSSETALYALKRLQTKKRKIVDRRASKSRKIRYNVHEKIVSFMAPQRMDIPPMAPKLFENLFGLKTQNPTSVN